MKKSWLFVNVFVMHLGKITINVVIVVVVVDDDEREREKNVLFNDALNTLLT